MGDLTATASHAALPLPLLLRFGEQWGRQRGNVPTSAHRGDRRLGQREEDEALSGTRHCLHAPQKEPRVPSVSHARPTARSLGSDSLCWAACRQEPRSSEQNGATLGTNMQITRPTARQISRMPRSMLPLLLIQLLAIASLSVLVSAEWSSPSIGASDVQGYSPFLLSPLSTLATSTTSSDGSIIPSILPDANSTLWADPAVVVVSLPFNPMAPTQAVRHKPALRATPSQPTQSQTVARAMRFSCACLYSRVCVCVCSSTRTCLWALSKWH